jgi:hypothetical protein
MLLHIVKQMCTNKSDLSHYFHLQSPFGFDGDSYVHFNRLLGCSHCVQVGCFADMTFNNNFCDSSLCTGFVCLEWAQSPQTPSYVTHLHPHSNNFSPEEKGTPFVCSVTHLHLVQAHKNIPSSC